MHSEEGLEVFCDLPGMLAAVMERHWMRRRLED